jgi:outer membrane protein assembly factor BamB
MKKLIFLSILLLAFFCIIPFVHSLEGTLKWNYTTGGSIRSSPAIGSDGTIYVKSFDRKLYAINPSGTHKWTYVSGSSHLPICDYPAIASDGTIYVADKNLYAIKPDGTLKWRYGIGNKIESSPAIGSDGTIYVGSDDGKLYALTSSSSSLASSSWPMFQHDKKHTGEIKCTCWGPCLPGTTLLCNPVNNQCCLGPSTTSTIPPSRGRGGGGGGRMPYKMSISYTNIVVISAVLTIMVVLIFGFFKYFTKKK